MDLALVLFTFYLSIFCSPSRVSFLFSILCLLFVVCTIASHVPSPVPASSMKFLSVAIGVFGFWDLGTLGCLPWGNEGKL